jgi:hypothetical protein
MLSIWLVLLVGSVFPQVEDPWPDRIGFGFPIVLAGVGTAFGWSYLRIRAAGASREGDRTVQHVGVLDRRAVLRDVGCRSGSLQPVKRFVIPELMPSYVLLAMGALIYLLESSDSAFAHVGAFGLFAVGVWIVFRPQKFTAGARASLKALLGAVRSTGSR